MSFSGGGKLLSYRDVRETKPQMDIHTRAYDKEAALDSVIYRLVESMPGDLQDKCTKRLK